MGMSVPLHVLVGNPSDNNIDNNIDDSKIDEDVTWRSNLDIGSEIDYKSKDNTWHEARVVNVSPTHLFIHCLSWIDKTSDLYLIEVSRDSPRVSRSHSHVRDWREQLRVSTPVEIHKSLLSEDTSSSSTKNEKRPIYRCTSAKDPKGSDDIKTYYIHYVNGEWWLGAHLDKPHGYLYIKSYAKNPLELGGGGGGEVPKKEEDDGVFKYDDDMKREEISMSSIDAKEDEMFDIDDDLETKSSSWFYWDMEATMGSSKWREDSRLRVIDVSNTMSNTMSSVDDEYPDAIMLVGHQGIQSGRMNEVYTRYVRRYPIVFQVLNSIHSTLDTQQVPASQLNAKSGWKRAKVKRVDFKNNRIDLAVRTDSYYYSYSSYNRIIELDLSSELFCMEGTHLVKDKEDSGDAYAKDLKNESNKFGAGVVGLRNLGNTCYMNAMLQCMFASRDLCAYFLEEEEEDLRDLNLTNVLGMFLFFFIKRIKTHKHSQHSNGNRYGRTSCQSVSKISSCCLVRTCRCDHTERF